MFTTRVRTLFVCSTPAAPSACHSSKTISSKGWAGLGLALLAVTIAACDEPPPTAPGSPTTVVLAQQQTTTVPGTELRLTATSLATPAEVLCLAVVGSPCGLSPHVTLRVETPGAQPSLLALQVPGPPGAPDRVSYGGYSLRLDGLEPAWNPEQPVEKERYRLVFVVTRE